MSRKSIFKIVAICRICLCFATGALALTNMNIKVPEAVRTGDSVTLACYYDLESAALYTIKWFRNEVEFYRYVPKESPPYQTFHIPHVKVNVSASNWINVTLVHVERETSGEFKCEVTADAPLFQTEARASSLIVADIPQSGPKLRTDMFKVAPGAHVRANCTSPGSYPRINMTWFLNDMEIDQNIGLIAENSAAYYDSVSGLEFVVSTVSIRATPDSFKKGKMKLRCLGTMFDMYLQFDEVELLEDTPQVALIMISIDRTNSGWQFSNECSELKWIFFVVLFILYHPPPG